LKRSPQSKNDDDEDVAIPRPRINSGDCDEEERPKRRRVRRDKIDNDNLPRPRKRRKKSRWDLGIGKIVAIALGLLLVFGVLGFGIYTLVGDLGENLRTKTPPPTGWQEFTYKNDKFKAYLPSQPSVGSMELNFKQLLADLGSDANYPEVMTTYQSLNSTAHVNVAVARYKSRLSSKDRSNALSMSLDGKKISSMEKRSVRWLGTSAEEFVNSGALTRVAIIDNLVFVTAISNEKGGRAPPEVEAGLFDNFQIVD